MYSFNTDFVRYCSVWNSKMIENRKYVIEMNMEQKIHFSPISFNTFRIIKKFRQIWLGPWIYYMFIPTLIVPQKMMKPMKIPPSPPPTKFEFTQKDLPRTLKSIYICFDYSSWVPFSVDSRHSRRLLNLGNKLINSWSYSTQPDTQ